VVEEQKEKEEKDAEGEDGMEFLLNYADKLKTREQESTTTTDGTFTLINKALFFSGKTSRVVTTMHPRVTHRQHSLPMSRPFKPSGPTDERIYPLRYAFTSPNESTRQVLLREMSTLPIIQTLK
jgi:hypothetical protein